MLPQDFSWKLNPLTTLSRSFSLDSATAMAPFRLAPHTFARWTAYSGQSCTATKDQCVFSLRRREDSQTLISIRRRPSPLIRLQTRLKVSGEATSSARSIPAEVRRLSGDQ